MGRQLLPPPRRWTVADAVESAARLSECGRYRYWLGHYWEREGDSLTFVMLNPSTANASIDDPTIRRCMGFARREGYVGVTVLNLYAYRATDPKQLLTCGDPVGPENDEYLRMSLAERLRRGSPVVAAWGANAKPDRVEQVLGLIDGVDWRCLGTTKSGSPRRPLDVKGDQSLVPFQLAPAVDRG
jgi:hypothetical protein